jgi:hypothetical protein
MRVNGNGGPVRPKQGELESPKSTGSKEASQPQARGAASRQSSSHVGANDGFESAPKLARGSAGGTAQARGAKDVPAEVRTGQMDYYRQRQDDFVRRNPGQKPPDYYMGYGNKYAEKFASLGPKDLSPEGLKWRDRTLKALQDAMETKRMEDPAAFAQLERDPEAFRKFAYDTHADAYVKSGLFELPAQDLVKIASTPEFRDLLNKDGVKQIADVLGRLKPEDVARIGEESLKQIGHALDDFRKNFKLPKLPLPPLLPLPSLRLP